MTVKPGSLPHASSNGRRPRVQSVATGMSAPMSRPNRAASGLLWSRRLPMWSCITRPSSLLIRANSFSMCASNRRASACELSPASAFANSADASRSVRREVSALVAAWSVAVPPSALNAARRSASTVTNVA